jgi:ABC-type lipoprotein export system ATPase subunit
MGTILETNNLWKIYSNYGQKVNAIQDINLMVEAGEFIAIMGPSGCGKSTLLHLLGAMDSPSQGNVYLDSKNLSEMNDYERTKLRCLSLGFIFQTFNLLPTYTALENVEIVMKLAGISKNARRKRALELLEQVDLKDRINNLPKQLSGGQRQRVAIARALANSPDILFADEPTGNLDVNTGEKIIELLNRVNSKGQTIVMVTHNNELAKKRDRVVKMRDGKIIV